jgi:hypothetical protein
MPVKIEGVSIMRIPSGPWSKRGFRLWRTLVSHRKASIPWEDIGSRLNGQRLRRHPEPLFYRDNSQMLFGDPNHESKTSSAPSNTRNLKLALMARPRRKQTCSDAELLSIAPL